MMFEVVRKGDKREIYSLVITGGMKTEVVKDGMSHQQVVELLCKMLNTERKEREAMSHTASRLATRCGESFFDLAEVISNRTSYFSVRQVD